MTRGAPPARPVGGRVADAVSSPTPGSQAAGDEPGDRTPAARSAGSRSRPFRGLRAGRALSNLREPGDTCGHLPRATSYQGRADRTRYDGYFGRVRGRIAASAAWSASARVRRSRSGSGCVIAGSGGPPRLRSGSPEVLRREVGGRATPSAERQRGRRRRVCQTCGVARLPVKKTYKLYIGGEFPRSESGRTYEAEGQNVARASRKDLRDAVVAARGGAAEVGGRDRLQPRPGAVPDRRDDGGAHRRARRVLDRHATRWSARSTAGSGTRASPTSSRRRSARRTRSPGRTSTSPCPSRPASSGSLAPDEPPLLGLVSRLAPALVGGNTVVAIASETGPLAAIELAEVLATSDLPGGVVNLLTGYRAELAPWLASHMDVNAIDVTGADERCSRRPRARPPPRT